MIGVSIEYSGDVELVWVLVATLEENVMYITSCAFDRINGWHAEIATVCETIVSGFDGWSMSWKLRRCTTDDFQRVVQEYAGDEYLSLSEEKRRKRVLQC
tara:strand:+ start:1386 stop:1685 length:300 start_codon:yes stop_codon:yes gene_type:complete